MFYSIAVVLLALVASSQEASAQSQIPGPNGVIHACIRLDRDGDTGKLARLVAQDEACKKNEQRVQWNVAGPKGEKGATGATGPAGPMGPAGPAGPQASLPVMMCPDGHVLQGINANGTPACASLVAGAFTPPPDTRRPTILDVNPPNGATVQSCLNGLSVDVIAAAFDEPMDASTINDQTFTVRSIGPDGPVAGHLLPYNGVDQAAYFLVDGRVPPNTVIVATLTTGVTDLAGNHLAADREWRFVSSVGTCDITSVQLGMTQEFGVVAGGGMFTTSTDQMTTVYGSVALGASAACTADGGPCTPENPIINGRFVANDAEGVAAGAQLDLRAAIADAQSRESDVTISELTGRPLPPGVYSSASAMTIEPGGVVVLDGRASPTGVWIFQVGASFTVGDRASMLLMNGASPNNVYFVVEGGATFGSEINFTGIVLAKGDITAGSHTNISGRLLSLGQVTLQSTTVHSGVQ